MLVLKPLLCNCYYFDILIELFLIGIVFFRQQPLLLETNNILPKVTLLLDSPRTSFLKLFYLLLNHLHVRIESVNMRVELYQTLLHSQLHLADLLFEFCVILAHSVRNIILEFVDVIDLLLQDLNALLGLEAPLYVSFL